MGKTILILGNYPPPYGGVPHHIDLLTQHLVARGWTCHILAGGTQGEMHGRGLHVYKPTLLSKLVGWVRQIGNRQFARWNRGGTLHREEFKLWLRYKMYADVGERVIRENQVDLVVAYNLFAYGPVAAYLAMKYQLPMAINIFGEIYKSSSMIRNRRFFEAILARADLLISCSAHCGRSIERLGVPNTVKAITYGVNLSHFCPATGGPANGAGSPSGVRRLVLFVGRLGAEMGLDTFVQLARRLIGRRDDVDFLMVGAHGELVDMARKECERSEGRMRMEVAVDYAKLPDRYRAATVLVVPTRGDRTCSSLAAMEAMATGKPVVAYAVGGIPEIIRHEETGLLVNAEDADALARAVTRLLDDPRKLAEMGEAALQEAGRCFDENAVNARFEAEYAGLLK